MIIYKKNIKDFIKDVKENKICEFLKNEIITNSKHHDINNSVINSWKESLDAMKMVLENDKISDNFNIYLEYEIPYNAKRIDFIIEGEKTLIFIELKRWSNLKISNKKNPYEIIETEFNGTTYHQHPSDQINSYVNYIESYVDDLNDIKKIKAVYLHNIGEEGAKDLFNNKFSYSNDIHYFYMDDENKFRNFIIENIDPIISNGNKMEKVDVLKPYFKKPLIDMLNDETLNSDSFILIGKQYDAYKTIIDKVFDDKNENKFIYIVKGGPGTGKSVISWKLFMLFYKNDIKFKLIYKSIPPRKQFEKKLKGKYKDYISGSGFTFADEEIKYRVLIVDEAQRLVLNYNKSIIKCSNEDQISEIINGSVISVFFLDENQMIMSEDIGSEENIRKKGQECGVDPENIKTIKFDVYLRMKGGDKFIESTLNLFGLESKKDFIFDIGEYKFQILDNLQALKKIENLNIVATHDHASLGVKSQYDIQGIESMQLGVVVGHDLFIDDNGNLEFDISHNIQAKKYYKKYNDEKYSKQIIKNTYLNLFTRSIEKTYVWFMDDKVKEFFADMINEKK